MAYTPGEGGNPVAAEGKRFAQGQPVAGKNRNGDGAGGGGIGRLETGETGPGRGESKIGRANGARQQAGPGKSGAAIARPGVAGQSRDDSSAARGKCGAQKTDCQFQTGVAGSG